MTVLFMVIPFFMKNSVLTNELSYFFYLYSLTYVIKNKNIDFKLDVKFYFLVSLIGIILISYFTQRFYISRAIEYDYNSITRLSSNNSLMLVICAYSLYMVFDKKIEWNSTMINYLSKASFGVYLIHCFPIIKNELLWNFFGFKTYFDNPFFPVVVMLISLCIYFLAIILDIPERYLSYKIIRCKAVKKICSRIDSNMMKYEI